MKKINVVLLGGFFHQKMVEVEDDGDPMIEVYPQPPAQGPTWVYKIASDAELTLLGLSRLLIPVDPSTVPPPRYATLVGQK